MAYTSSVTSSLAHVGWKRDGESNFAGVDFDIIMTKNFGLVPWMVFIKEIPALDLNAALVWQKKFEMVRNKRCKGNMLKGGRPVMFCLIASQVSPETLVGIQQDLFGEFVGPQTLYDAPSILLIPDLSNKIVWSKVPSLPGHSKPAVNEVTDILNKCAF